MASKAMDERAFPFSKPLVFLIVLAALYTIGLATLAAHGVIGPVEHARTLWTIVFNLILTWWVYSDKKARDFRLPFEFEFFVFVAWPVVVPYYLYRRRGGLGLFYGLGIWALYAAPDVTSALIYALRG